MSYFISVPLPETAMSFLWILVVDGRVANRGHRDGRLVWSTYLSGWFGFVILPGCGLASQTKRQSAKGRTMFVSRTYTGKVSTGKEETVPRVGGGAGSGPSVPPSSHISGLIQLGPGKGWVLRHTPIPGCFSSPQ